MEIPIKETNKHLLTHSLMEVLDPIRLGQATIFCKKPPLHGSLAAQANPENELFFLKNVNLPESLPNVW